MEWVQDQLLRLATKYWCRDVAIDAARLRIERWEGGSILVHATDLRVSCEGCTFSVPECTVDVAGGWSTGAVTSVAIATQDTATLEAPWRAVGELATEGWCAADVSLQAAVLELRCGSSKARMRNAALTATRTDATVAFDVAVVSHNDGHVGEARGLSASIATRAAVGDRRCDATTRKLAKAEVDVTSGDIGVVVDAPLRAFIDEAAPSLAHVGEEGMCCALKCSRCVVRLLGTDVLCEAGVHLTLVDDDVWPRWRCDVAAPALRWASEDEAASASIRISWLTREGWALASARGNSELESAEGYRRDDFGRRVADAGAYDDATARSRALYDAADGYEPPGWRHPNFVKKPVLDGGPAIRADVKIDGALRDAGLCTAVLHALWGGAAFPAPSYACTLRVNALLTPMGTAERAVATVARTSSQTPAVATVAMRALRGACLSVENGTDDAPGLVARAAGGEPGEVVVQALAVSAFALPQAMNSMNLRVTASVASLMVLGETFGVGLRACEGNVIMTDEVVQGRAASLDITVTPDSRFRGVRLSTLRGVGAECALLNGGVVARCRISADTVDIDPSAADAAASMLRECAANWRAAPKPENAPRAVALQARCNSVVCGSLPAARLTAEVKVVDGAADASLTDAAAGDVVRYRRPFEGDATVEVVAKTVVDDALGTADGQAVAELLSAAMAFAF